ncbi:MAG: hypothetical protein C4527_06175 [Candidatus Omnitrophota bacterium]|jgi:hypothetical protein|nr:MAG: hypothetical protein C4527_06175 [Candidatus Omnitrophota bacterium]
MSNQHLNRFDILLFYAGIGAVFLSITGGIFGLYPILSLYEIVDLFLLFFCLFTGFQFFYVISRYSEPTITEQFNEFLSRPLPKWFLGIISVLPFIYWFCMVKWGIVFPFVESNFIWFDHIRLVAYRISWFLIFLLVWFYLIPRKWLSSRSSRQDSWEEEEPDIEPFEIMTPIAKVRPGMKTTEPVYNRNGGLLVDAGVVLTPEMIRILKDNQVAEIDIEADGKRTLDSSFREEDLTDLFAELELDESGDGSSMTEEERQFKMRKAIARYSAEKPEEAATVCKVWLSEGETMESFVADIPPPSPPSPSPVMETIRQREPLWDLDPEIPSDASSMTDAFLQGGVQEREIVYQRAFSGSQEAQNALMELVMRGNGDAVVMLLRANLLDESRGILYRNDEWIVTQISRLLKQEYPADGGVTRFVKGMIFHQNKVFAGYLLNHIIRLHGATVLYDTNVCSKPILLTERRKREIRLEKEKSDQASDRKDGHNEIQKEDVEQSNDQLALIHSARLAAMFYLHSPASALRYFGSAYDPFLRRESVLFEEWAHDPIIAHAFLIQVQSDSNYHSLLMDVVREAIVSDRLRPDQFEFHRFPGFVEFILPTLIQRDETVRSFADKIAS